MKKVVPDPPSLTLQDAEQCDSQSLDRAAVRRALDYYLHDHKPARPISTAIFAIPDSVNSEAALAQASDLLRCAVASASEAGGWFVRARARPGVVGHASGGAGQGVCR